MAEEETDGDFTACSVDVLNRFFAAYRNSHSQGGTNTRQRNLPTYSSGWHSGTTTRIRGPGTWCGTARVKSRPSTLAEEFIRDLLEVTGGGPRAT
jgi:integrase/recombinase XerD